MLNVKTQYLCLKAHQRSEMEAYILLIYLSPFQTFFQTQSSCCSYHLVVVEVSIDGEAMASYLPLVAWRPSLTPPQNPGVTLCPEELATALTVLCPINTHRTLLLTLFKNKAYKSTELIFNILNSPFPKYRHSISTIGWIMTWINHLVFSKYDCIWSISKHTHHLIGLP